MKKNKQTIKTKHDVVLGYHLNIMTCGVARVNDKMLSLDVKARAFHSNSVANLPKP